MSQRPRTSYSVRDAFSPSPRIQSAQPHISMAATPRTQVSMAGFFDWSTTEENTDSSMSTIYRKIANLSQKGKFGKGNKNWCSDGVHISPGRMFLRTKAELTKGEREIIAGICKNRSDTNKDSRNPNVNLIKSHKDAWLVGKRISKRANQIDLDDDSSFKVPDHLFSKIDSPKQTSNTVCYMCVKCKDECSYHRDGKGEETGVKTCSDEGRKAPPSTPTNSPKSSRRQTKANKDNIDEGAIFIEAGKTFYDPEEKSKRKKVFVDVFLPKFSTSSLNEEDTSLEIATGNENNVGHVVPDKVLQHRLEKKVKPVNGIVEKDNFSVARTAYVHANRQLKNSPCNSSRGASSSGE